MPQGMEYMYDPSLRAKAIDVMRKQGTPLTGDNLQRAMMLLNQADTTGASEDHVEAAGDAETAGRRMDMLTMLDKVMKDTNSDQQNAAVTSEELPPVERNIATQVPPSKPAMNAPQDDGRPAPPIASNQVGGADVASTYDENAASIDDVGDGRLGRDLLGVGDVLMSLLGIAPGKLAAKGAGAAIRNEPVFTELLKRLGGKRPQSSSARQLSLPNPGTPKQITGPQKQLAAPQKRITASPEAQSKGIVDILKQRGSDMNMGEGPIGPHSKLAGKRKVKSRASASDARSMN